MKKRIVPYLLVLGTPDFPRFRIANTKGEVWTGDGWNDDQANGLLYAIATDAARQCQAIQREQFADKALVERFIAPIRIEVHSDSGLSLDDLKDWLGKSVNVQVAYGTNGNGPGDTLVLLEIFWDELKLDRQVKRTRSS